MEPGEWCTRTLYHPCNLSVNLKLFHFTNAVLKPYPFLIILLHFTIICVLEVMSVVSVWWKYYIMVCYCTSLLNVMLKAMVLT